MAVTDDAIEKIKAMIVSGELPEGSRLPREEALADQLGLSRNSLREAVRALVAMRILITRQGDGTYVSSLEPHLLLDGLTFASDVAQGPAAAQLLQVRRLLEPQAVALAASRVTEDDVAALTVILDRSAHATTAEEFVELDVAFHRHIIELVGNPVLSLLLEVVSTRTQRVRVLRGIDTAAALVSAHREHQAILAALAARDPALAAATTAVHVAGLEQWVAEGSAASHRSAAVGG
ncbi:FadR/GntR family transcriptional regulator [Peterkaempfera sp. SMS 1(5)a]|uniref:FadR/GntR family transcriptional regulator n=1 Tax=Peterkaempfera podocarpi TaxID=3232308 RepID=UPI00366D54DC